MESSNINQLAVTATPRGSAVATSAVRSSDAPSAPSGDKVELSSEGMYASSLVQQVSNMATVRPNLVADFQKTVRTTNYPPPALVDGFFKLMGKTE